MGRGSPRQSGAVASRLTADRQTEEWLLRRIRLDESMPIKEGAFQPEGFETAGIDFNKCFDRFARGTLQRDFDQWAIAAERNGNHDCFRRDDICLGRK